MTKDQINFFMEKAIEEGRKALPNCLPNPPVGCVIVKDDQIIATGFTNEPGQHHAEAMALASLDKSLNDLSMFVTLEPCSFQGRTPSCAIAITQSKIKKVYVGILDPHPKNRGAGIQILKKAGVKVEIGFLAEKIQDELNDFLIKE